MRGCASICSTMWTRKGDMASFWLRISIFLRQRFPNNYDGLGGGHYDGNLTLFTRIHSILSLFSSRRRGGEIIAELSLKILVFFLFMSLYLELETWLGLASFPSKCLCKLIKVDQSSPYSSLNKLIKFSCD